jgi:AraC-like DNA-binding protein
VLSYPFDMHDDVAPMAYRERPAPPGLGLACVWSQSVPRDAAPYVQRVVPDGCVDLIWSDWDGQIHVAGPDTGPFLADIPPGGRYVGVRFRPGLAPPALGVPADAVRDGRVPLRELWGAEAEALADTLAGAGADPAADADPAAALTHAVAARLRTADPADPAMPALVRELSDTSVREAAVRLGLSERQLRRRSLTAFGYGPKTLQRILRFQRALKLARDGIPPAEVAYAMGFADQAHLAHEVRDLAGASLTELLSPSAAGGVVLRRSDRTTA